MVVATAASEVVVVATVVVVVVVVVVVGGGGGGRGVAVQHLQRLCITQSWRRLHYCEVCSSHNQWFVKPTRKIYRASQLTSRPGMTPCG